MSQHATTARADGLQFGMTLSSEDHGPTALVEQARSAEELGFDFVSISDHFHPWVTEQGHSPFVWTVLGAIAAATERLPVAVGVTCPIVRIHPAIVAHAAATTALLLEDRFTLGLGTGEALNEHILGHRWPPPETRRAMLAEAIHVMRELWTGETVDHRGDFYQVENARLFDPPPAHLPLVISGFGRASMELAAEWTASCGAGPRSCSQSCSAPRPAHEPLEERLTGRARRSVAAQHGRSRGLHHDRRRARGRPARGRRRQHDDRLRCATRSAAAGRRTDRGADGLTRSES